MRKQLTDLRRRMVQEKIDAYLIPSDDFHGSEYVGDHFKCRGYVSGFTGSAGTLLVTADWAGLWTDGRYFLQAAQQLDGSGITLCKMGEKTSYRRSIPERNAAPGPMPGLRRPHSHRQTLSRAGNSAGRPGYHFPHRRGSGRRRVAEPAATIRRPSLGTGRSLLRPLPGGKSWHRSAAFYRNGRPMSCCFLLWMTSPGCSICAAGDVACCPVVLSFLALTASDTQLFVNPLRAPGSPENALAADGITLAPYDGIYAYAAALPAHSTVWLDEEKTSCALWRAAAHCPIVSAANPTLLPKAIKNAAEIANERTAHLRDGAALTQWIFWLKATVGRSLVTERSAAEKLEALRARQPHYLEPSFDPIVAYGSHGAIVHYSATEESDILWSPRALLSDTGGHYLEGTTDVTRTIALGPVSADMKRHYTLVLRSHLHLLHAQFLYGCRGSALDMIARQPLWQEGLDYNHGTGHGVGYLLSVHEGPNSFRFRSAGQDAVLESGMILSDEPGLYLEGRYGIRLGKPSGMRRALRK